MEEMWLGPGQQSEPQKSLACLWAPFRQPPENGVRAPSQHTILLQHPQNWAMIHNFLPSRLRHLAPFRCFMHYCIHAKCYPPIPFSPAFMWRGRSVLSTSHEAASSCQLYSNS
jgi:hypothetical protein